MLQHQLSRKTRQPSARVKILSVLTLLAAGLVITAPSSSAAVATAGAVSVRPGAAIAGEVAKVRGKLPPRKSRTVILQRRMGTSWVAEKKKVSRAKGTFRFTVETPARSTKYRVFAPRARLGGRWFAAVATPTKRLVTQPQTADLTGPDGLHVGADGTVEATFRPTREARPVTLEKRVGSSWTAVDSATESSTGVASFSITRSTPGSDTYRVVAGGWHGAVSTTTNSLQVSFVEPSDTTPPAPITGLSVTSTTTNTVAFSWTNPTDSDLAEVWVTRATGPTPPATRSGGDLVDILATPTHDVADPDVEADTQYSYSFFTVDDDDNTSAPVTRTLTTGGLAPGRVWNLTATTVTASSVTLDWTNPTDPDFDGVMIRRSVGATPPASPTAGTLVTDEAAPGSSHTQTGLSPATQYSYALFAHDADGNYADGATVTVITTEGNPPGPVTGLTLTGTTASTASFSWTNPGDGDLAGVMVRRVVGTAPPADPSAGALAGTVAKPGATFVDTGLTPGTQYAYAFFAYDTSDNTAPAATKTATTAAVGQGDWLQARADGERRSWAPNETTLHTGNAASVAEEWDVRPGVPAVSGGSAFVYGADEYAGTSVRVYDLGSGSLSDEFATTDCSTGQLALTATLVVVQCSSSVRAYARAGGHALVWDTATTDPGQQIQRFFLSGTAMLIQGSDRVAAYRLSDGQRLWQQLLPTGAGAVNDVAVSGTTVLIAYDDRLRALSLTTGAQTWSVSGAGSNEVIAAGGWAYVHNATELRRYAIADGAAGWSVTPEYGVYRLLAADSDTVYVWTAQFDFSSPYPSILRALRVSDGAERWSYNVPTRVGAVGVTGDLVWLTTTEIYSQGRYSALIGLARATGEEEANIAFSDNMYGGPDAFAVGGGKVILDQGGSFGGPVPHRLRVFGVSGVVPKITTGALTLGRTDTSYEHQMTAVTPPAASTWSVVGGSLPTGLSLSSAGLISGTPTAAGSSQVTIKVTSDNGRTAQLSFPLVVVNSAAAAWTAGGRDATRNAFEHGTGVLDIAAAPSLSARWTTQAPGTPSTYSTPNVLADANRIYTVSPDGLLKAFDATGSGAARAPLWAVGADAGGFFQGRITLTGDRIIVNGQDGSLYAIRVTDGVRLWKTTDTTLTDDAIVVGSVVAARDTSGKVRAVSRADGSPLWGGDPTTMGGFQTSLSSDGTRLFGVAGCVLYALSPATGAEIWHADMRGKLVDSCFAGYMDSAAPIVVGGKVYASEVGSRMIADAATGSVLRTVRVSDYYFSEGVVVGGLWMYFDSDTIAAMDIATGRIVWRKPWPVGDGGGAAPHLSASGDLVVVTAVGAVTGIDRRTGETVWDGGSYTGSAGTATIGGDRIFLATSDGVRAYGPL